VFPIDFDTHGIEEGVIDLFPPPSPPDSDVAMSARKADVSSSAVPAAPPRSEPLGDESDDHDEHGALLGEA
jgi:hypothetical protein